MSVWHFDYYIMTIISCQSSTLTTLVRLYFHISLALWLLYYDYNFMWDWYFDYYITNIISCQFGSVTTILWLKFHDSLVLWLLYYYFNFMSVWHYDYYIMTIILCLSGTLISIYWPWFVINLPCRLLYTLNIYCIGRANFLYWWEMSKIWFSVSRTYTYYVSPSSHI